jgi:hypothetical protein
MLLWENSGERARMTLRGGLPMRSGMMERGDSISELSEWTLRVNLGLSVWQLVKTRERRGRRRSRIRLMEESNQRTKVNARGEVGSAKGVGERGS